MRRSISFLAYMPALIWYGLIFLLSNQSDLPGFEQSLLDFIWFKTAHLLVFGVFTALVLWATQVHLNVIKLSWPVKLVVILVIGLLALLDEYHQSYTPNRSPALRDVGIDLLGSLLTLGIWTRYNVPHFKNKPGM